MTVDELVQVIMALRLEQRARVSGKLLTKSKRQPMDSGFRLVFGAVGAR
jgi:hypothetical protein